jgi:thioredoxin-like negative regulator of GroEL
MTTAGLPALTMTLLLLGHPSGQGIKWEKSFDDAIKRAKASGKPVLVDVWTEWCGWCHRLDQTTYVDPVVVKLSEDFVAVKLNGEGGGGQALLAAKYEVTTFPTILFLSPSGRQLMRVNGFQGPGQFPRSMQAALETAARVMSWEAALEKNGRDAAVLLNLGVHLFEQEFYEDSRELLYRTVKADQPRPVADRAKARLLLGIIQTYDRKYAEAERLLKQALELKPTAEQQPKIMFVLGRAYLNWGKHAQARAVFEQILAEHPSSHVAGKARDALSALERKSAGSSR